MLSGCYCDHKKSNNHSEKEIQNLINCKCKLQVRIHLYKYVTRSDTNWDAHSQKSYRLGISNLEN